jgi:hypothetical protein
MSFKISTGLRNHMLVTGSVKSGMDGGVIKIYAGTEPADADASIGAATLLDTISNNDTGTGINFDATPTSGVLVKAPAEVWSGTCVASGTATFYRFVSLADDGTSSTTFKRMQGTVGVVGADLLVSSTAFVSANLRQINSFSAGMPAG